MHRLSLLPVLAAALALVLGACQQQPDLASTEGATALHVTGMT